MIHGLNDLFRSENNSWPELIPQSLWFVPRFQLSKLFVQNTGIIKSIISGLTSLKIMETRANFWACENIPVVIETFLLKVKLNVIMGAHSLL